MANDLGSSEDRHAAVLEQVSDSVVGSFQEFRPILTSQGDLALEAIRRDIAGIPDEGASLKFSSLVFTVSFSLVVISTS